MDLTYHFFDRAAFDLLWGLSWQEFRRKWNRGAWTSRPLGEKGVYNGDSLRDLIAFCIEPDLNEKEVEYILNRRSIRWTVLKSIPQSFLMEEVIGNVPKLRRRQFSVVVFADADFTVLLSCAVDAYLEGRIDRRTLRAVLALHPAEDLKDFLLLTTNERRRLGRLVRAQDDMFRPIYRWQGPGAFVGEEWPGCLREADTRRFVEFLFAAWKGNWEVPHVKDRTALSFVPAKGQTARFRDFVISQELVRRLKNEYSLLERPCVLRSWS